MILGTYWYFGFPTGLYEFEYFEFGPGYGGHADNPAELVTYIEVEFPERMIYDLKSCGISSTYLAHLPHNR
jgi:hypothetical protein